MILFKQEHKPMILSGKKTQTRRTGKKRWKLFSTHLAKTGFRKDDAFARILITGIREERLGDISEEDARKEGYTSIEDYMIIFQLIYGKWNPDETVWVLDFHLLAEVVSHETL